MPDATLDRCRGEQASPLCIDLFCGLGGFSAGFLAEGYECIGFDIERHDYGAGGYPGQLVIQDVLTIHGSQFKDAACLVASPPCQAYSYMAMPWSRAKKIAAEYRDGTRDVADLTRLFDACFRIQREACEAAGHHIPLVVENVKGAQPWVGRAKWHYGSFYLWGDVPTLMPSARVTKVPQYSDPRRNGGKGAHLTSAAESQRRLCICPDKCDCQNPEPEGDLSAAGAVAHCSNNCPVHNLNPEIVPECRARVHRNGARDDGPGRSFQSAAVEGVKQGGGWYGNYQAMKAAREGGTDGPLGASTRMFSSKFPARKAASARIAMIPLELSRYIARTYKLVECVA